MVSELTTPMAGNVPDLDNAQIERIEGVLLQIPQDECPLIHRFAPGVYMREILMKKGLIVIGHEHKTRHLNIILAGAASVIIEDRMALFKSGDVFISEPGVRKILYIHEECRWATIHPTDETDLAKLKDNLIIESPTYLARQAQLNGSNDKPAISP